MSFMSMTDAAPRGGSWSSWPWSEGWNGLATWPLAPWMQATQWWMSWWGLQLPASAEPMLRLMASPGDAGAPVAHPVEATAPNDMPSLPAAPRRSAVVTPISKATPKRRAVVVAPDDLVRLEGIGPKIAERLQAAGIRTFAELANTPVARLEAVLAEAGPRFRLAAPQTWPEQAALLAAGDEAGFAALTAKLTAGRR